MARKKRLMPRYSGNASRKFWDEVNKRPHLYNAAVLLQDMESTLLKWLANPPTHFTTAGSPLTYKIKVK